MKDVFLTLETGGVRYHADVLGSLLGVIHPGALEELGIKDSFQNCLRALKMQARWKKPDKPGPNVFTGPPGI